MTDTREEFQGLFSLYFWVLVGAGAVVTLLVVFALLRYRGRSGPVPSRRSEAKLVEALFAVVLAGFVGLLVWKTFGTEDKVDALAAGRCEAVQVTAFQWGWRFSYPKERITVAGDQNSPPTAAVPVDATVCFSVRSRDVIHAFWIPDLRFKKDAFPTFTNRFDLVFDRTGTFVGRCAEFCGLEHAGMTFRIRALREDDFQAWARESAGAQG